MLLIKVSKKLNNILSEKIIKDVVDFYNKEDYEIKLMEDSESRACGHFTMKVIYDCREDLILFNNIKNSSRNARFIQYFPTFITNNNSGKKFFYIINSDSSDSTEKSLFIYSVLEEIGVEMINKNNSFPFLLNEIKSIEKFMYEKTKFVSKKNHSTTIKKNKKNIYIHGKSGGGETGELILTILFCLKFSDKPIRLFEYNDSIQNKLTKNQVNFIKRKEVKIDRKVRSLNDLREKYEESEFENHRNQPKFRKNILNKFNVEKCICCDIKNVIASHIERQTDINKNNSYTIEEKVYKSTTQENGIFLCRNHDTLFENKIFSFDINGNLILKKNLTEKELEKIKEHIKNDTFKYKKIESKYITTEMYNNLLKHQGGQQYISYDDFCKLYQL